MTKHRAPKIYLDKTNLFREEDYLFSGFGYDIHFWRIDSFPRGANTTCSMGYPIGTSDIVFTWNISPNTFCTINMDKVEEFLECAEEALNNNEPNATTNCGSIIFKNTENHSINSLGSPSIKIKGSRIIAFSDNYSKEGFTDNIELINLLEWFEDSKVQTKITSTLL